MVFRFGSEISGKSAARGAPREEAQKPPQPAQEESEVVAGGGEHGVGAVAVAAREMIAAPSVLGFEVLDSRPDRGAAFYLTAG